MTLASERSRDVAAIVRDKAAGVLARVASVARECARGGALSATREQGHDALLRLTALASDPEVSFQTCCSKFEILCSKFEILCSKFEILCSKFVRARGGRFRRPRGEHSNSHGARPGHLIITMIKWIRTSRLSRSSA